MSDKLVNINSRASLVDFADELKMFIVKQKLFSEIKGKNYVNVEGWEFAGMATGISPVVKSVENISTETEIKYRAEVELISKCKVVGYGVAICSNKESSKRAFDEYAIASMAQTRAIGKAYRNKFAFLMKMAGYEATPAEEMTEISEIKQQTDNTSPSYPITEKQKGFIYGLYKDKNGKEMIEEEKEKIRKLTSRQASELIEKWRNPDNLPIKPEQPKEEVRDEFIEGLEEDKKEFTEEELNKTWNT